MAIYGPGEVKRNREVTDRASVEVTLKADRGLPHLYDRELEGLLASTAEAAIVTSQHPRTAIDIVVQVGWLFLGCSWVI